MIRLFQLLIPILLLLNITLSANTWSIGRLFYLLAMIMSSYLLFKSKYFVTSVFVIGLIFFTRVLEIITPELSIFRDIFTSMLFIIIGFTLYSGKIFFLRKFLLVFLLINIPIMFMQILGLHESLMYWVTDYAHDESILALHEIGTFKNVPLYPTLFVTEQEILYSIGQGRPAGLLPNNNTLSVIVAFAIIINIYARSKTEFFGADIIVCMITVMLMAKLAIGVLLITLAYTFVFADRILKRIALKQLFYFLSFLFIYSFLFPGLMAENFSAGSLAQSFFVRLLNITSSLGIDSNLLIGIEAAQLYGISTNTVDQEYQNPITVLLSSQESLIFIVAILIISFPRLKKISIRLKKLDRRSFHLRVLMILTTVISILTMPMFLGMHIFMLIIGSIFNSMKFKGT